MPWAGSDTDSAEALAARQNTAIPVNMRHTEWKNTDLNLGTILLWPYFLNPYATKGFVPYQTFSLDSSEKLTIKVSLLDRFLACMKPASIT